MGSNIEKSLNRAAQVVIKQCLGIRPRERVVVVTDRPCYRIGYLLWASLEKITDALLIEIKPRRIHGEEPPDLIAGVLKKCDVFIIPTSRSLTHTRARIEANRCGARGTTMPGITIEMMARTLNSDYKIIARRTKKLVDLLSRARTVLIKTPRGTDLELSLAGRRGHIDDGMIRRPGAFSNLPAGEAYIAPRETLSNGRIVFDGSFAPIGILKKPVTVDIRRGRLTRIQGNNILARIFGRYSQKERVLCELGIGTNHRARVTGNVLEDEKAMGTIHVAFGNNLGFGGNNKAGIHLDGVVKNPSVWLDRRLIVERGKFLA